MACFEKVVNQFAFKMQKTTLLILLVAMLGCVNERNQIEIDQITLSPIKKISQVNDSIFLSLVTDMNVADGNIYLTDFKNNRIVCIDTAYKFMRVFGGPGHGPGELNFPIGSVVNNNKLFVADEGHMSINVYSLIGEYLWGIKGVLPSTGRFIVEDSVYYGSSATQNNEPPIFMANMKGDVLTRFGTKTRLINSINKDAARVFHIEKWHDQLIAVCENDPVIERYSMNGTLIETVNISGLKHFDSYFRYIENKQEEDKRNLGMRGVCSLVAKSFVAENKLYLLLTGYDESKSKETSNNFLIFDIEKDKITPVKILKLENDNKEDAWYYSFIVIGQRLIAFDAMTFEIHEFSLTFQQP